MDVIFETSKGRQFTVEIWFFATVLEMKQNIQKYHGIPVDAQTLLFNGQVMADDGDTELYGVLEGSRIRLVTAPEPEDEEPAAKAVLTVGIAAKNRQLSLEHDAAETVARLKERIQEAEGIPAQRFALFVDGNELQDECRAVAEYGVREGSEVSVVMRPSPNAAAGAAGSAAGGGKRMRVLVLPKCGTKKIAVEVNPSDNVSELRKELQRIQGQMRNFHLPAEGYFFIYKQNVMDDDRTFRWHDVRHGDTIDIFNGSVTGGS